MIAQLLLASLFASSIVRSAVHDALWGARNGADAEITFQVLDVAGNPIPNVGVSLWYVCDYPKLKKWSEALKTDTNGCVVASGHVNCSIGIRADKDGYYESFEKIVLPKTKANPAIVDGKWQPYGEKRVIVLYRYENPIEMPGAYERTDVKIPAFGKWLQYDLEKGNWLPPYGDGSCPDVLLRFSYDAKNRYWDYVATMDVSFTNNPCAGFYVKKKERGSELECDYHANNNADYLTTFHFTKDGNSLDGTGCKQVENDEYVVYRTRTKVDESGNLVSAHYGKIVGGWFFSELMTFYHGYVFNPTPNDTNLEDAETYRRSLRRREQEREFREKRE